MCDYRHHREQIYSRLRQKGVFTWDWLYGQEYALASPLPVGANEAAELRAAAGKLGQIFAKTAAIVQAGGDDLMAELGIPAAARAAVRLNVLNAGPTLIGRFDFIRLEQGWKMLEFNSDTPGGIVEALYVNDAVCRYYGVRNPNAGLGGDIQAAFAHIVEIYRRQGYNTENIFFSALDWHEEDAGTARYLLQQSCLPARFVPLKDLQVTGDKLFARVEGTALPVDILYRLHPLGVLADDKDADDYPTGEHVLALIAGRKLAVINPPSALIAQTKALQALIWNLHEAGEFFSAGEQAAIAAYMLPTYLENRFSGRLAHVSKPVLGREGGGVIIYDKHGATIARDRERHYWDQQMVYQEYREIETIPLETLQGVFPGKVIWSAFLINGKGSAIGARAGGYITDDLSYYVPLCLQGE